MEWVYQGQWENNPYFLKKGDAFIAIFQKGTESTENRHDGVRIAHFAFRAETKNDYEEIKRNLKGKGIAFKEQDHGISNSIYIKDPDNLTVEITTYDL